MGVYAVPAMTGLLELTEKFEQLSCLAKKSIEFVRKLLKANQALIKLCLFLWVFSWCIKQVSAASICDTIQPSKNELALASSTGEILILDTSQLLQMCAMMCCQTLMQVIQDCLGGLHIVAAPVGLTEMVQCYSMGSEGMLNIDALVSQAIKNVSQVSRCMNNYFSLASEIHREFPAPVAPSGPSHAEWAAATTFAVLGCVAAGGILACKVAHQFRERCNPLNSYRQTATSEETASLHGSL